MSKPQRPQRPKLPSSGRTNLAILQPAHSTLSEDVDFSMELPSLAANWKYQTLSEDVDSSVESSSSAANWKHSVLYLSFFCSVIYFFHTQISHNLLIGHRLIKVRKTSPDLPLRFWSDRTFKILQMADMHYGNGRLTRCRDVLDFEFDWCSDLNTSHFLRKMIEAERPHFIVFTAAVHQLVFSQQKKKKGRK
ncbi:hypothetical protein FF1_022988 [Malus domestica]